MKKIFITSFHPLVSRNILQTDILMLLLKKGFLVYVLCPDIKVDFFKREFKEERVKIIGIGSKLMTTKEKLFKQIGGALLASSTTRQNRKERFKKDKRLLSYFVFLMINNILARSKLIHRCYRKLFYKFYDQDIFRDLLTEYKPDLIFSTDIFHNNDIRLMTEAKRHNIKVVGMVRSWDNITNKIIMPIIPDKLIVHNEIIKKEAVDFNEVNFEDIFISGIPQFDYYVNYSQSSKDTFFSKLGFSQDKKIIMFAPVGKKFIDSDWMQLQILHDAILNGGIEGGPQILVRFPPGDIMDIGKLQLSDKVKIYFDKPGIDFGGRTAKNTELNKKDMVWLADSLYYSDLLISAGSTLCIDMAAFGKPIICPKFDGEKNLEYFRSVVKMYDKYHYQYLVRTGGGKIVENKRDFINWINKYLTDPVADQEKRKIFLDEQCWKFDGQASRRISDYLLNNTKL